MSIIERSEFEPLIPHKGSMCLVDRVISWEAYSIHCTSMTHTKNKNPLRKNHQLSIVHAIEYGAQAMAIHGGLIAKAKGQTLAPGYLAAMRDIEIKVSRLDNISSELDIYATQVLADGGNLVYQFEVKNSGAGLISGRVTVMQMENNQ